MRIANGKLKFRNTPYLQKLDGPTLKSEKLKEQFFSKHGVVDEDYKKFVLSEREKNRKNDSDS